jgi:hypothetical protein
LFNSPFSIFLFPFPFYLLSDRLVLGLPMPPYLAKFAKEFLGADFLIQNGYNLADAEAEYGPYWLTK